MTQKIGQKKCHRHHVENQSQPTITRLEKVRVRKRVESGKGDKDITIFSKSRRWCRHHQPRIRWECAALKNCSSHLQLDSLFFFVESPVSHFCWYLLVLFSFKPSSVSFSCLLAFLSPLPPPQHLLVASRPPSCRAFHWIYPQLPLYATIFSAVKCSSFLLLWMPGAGLWPKDSRLHWKTRAFRLGVRVRVHILRNTQCWVFGDTWQCAP